MIDNDLKKMYLNNLKDLKNISNFLNLTEEQREELEKFLKTHEFTVEYREGMEEKKGKITFSYLDD